MTDYIILLTPLIVLVGILMEGDVMVKVLSVEMEGLLNPPVEDGCPAADVALNPKFPPP